MSFKQVILVTLNADRKDIFDIQEFQDFIANDAPQYEDDWFSLFDELPVMVADQVLYEDDIDASVKSQVQNQTNHFHGELTYRLADVYRKYPTPIERAEDGIKALSNGDIAEMINLVFDKETLENKA